MLHFAHHIVHNLLVLEFAWIHVRNWHLLRHSLYLLDWFRCLGLLYFWRFGLLSSFRHRLLELTSNLLHRLYWLSVLLLLLVMHKRSLLLNLLWSMVDLLEVLGLLLLLLLSLHDKLLVLFLSELLYLGLLWIH